MEAKRAGPETFVKYLARSAPENPSILAKTTLFSDCLSATWPLDREMESVLDSTTFIVKTFMRPECLDRLLQSIHQFYPGAKILVADDSREPVNRSDVRVFALPYDSGLSYGRNYLVDRVDTEFFVLLDDDVIFTPKTQVEKLIAPIKKGRFDLVGGYVEEKSGIFHWEGRFQSEGTTLTIHRGPRGKDHGILKVDVCHNFFAARTEAVRKIRWDDNFKMGEHTDFFLRAHDQIRIGVCPSVKIYHAPVHPSGYIEYRKRATEYRTLFLKKHGYRKWVNNLNRDQKKRPFWKELLRALKRRLFGRLL